MMTYLKPCWLVLVLFVLLPSLSACDDIPLSEYRIEWNTYDPKLHGQVVHFKVPMCYVLLEEKHIGDYLKEVVAIERILKTEESVFEPGGDAKRGYLSEQVKDGMAFTIKATYWYRRDWFNRELLGDRRHIVFVDENGIESVTLFTTLYQSDRPELKKLKDEGRLK